MSRKFCKECFAEITHVEVLCEDCLEDQQRSEKRHKPNKTKKVEEEEWISVPSPYKDYRNKK